MQIHDKISKRKTVFDHKENIQNVMVKEEPILNLFINYC